MFNDNLRYVSAEGGGVNCSAGKRRMRERLSVLQVTRPMYNDVWQRGDKFKCTN